MNRHPTTWLSDTRFDVAVAAVGLVLAVGMLPMAVLTSSLYVRTVPVVVGAACGLYLFSVRREGAAERRQPTLDASGVAAAELTGIALIGIATWAALAGTRTLGILLASGAVGAFVLLQTVFLSEDALDRRLVLAQVLAHAFVVRFTGLFTTPGFVGVDSWEHVTQYAAAVGAADSLGPLAGAKYLFAPFHHLITVVGSDLLGVSLRLSLYLVVGSTVALSVLLVYGTARYFVDARWALFATGAFAMTDQAIRWGMHIIPTSLGLVFFLGVVFAVARLLHAETGYADWALLAGSIVAVTLTHQVSAFVSLVFVGSAVVAQLVVGHVGWATPAGLAGSMSLGAESGDPITDGASRTSPGVVGLHWAFAFHLLFTGAIWAITPWGGEPFLTRMVGLLALTLRTSAGFLNLAGSESGGGAAAAAATVGTDTASPLMTRLATYVDAVGFLVLLFAAVLGGLALVRRHRSPQASHTLVVAIGAMLFFSLGLPLFGIRTFLPGRWFAFAYALMAVVGAAGLRYLGTQFSARAAAAVLVVLMLVFPFAMVAGKKATLDDPTFDEQWSQYAYSESEIAAMGTIGETTPASVETVFTDHPWRTAFKSSGAHFSDTINLTRVDGTDPPYDRVVYRDYQSTGAPMFTAAGGAVVTRQVDRDQICPVGSNRVYENQNAELCTRPGA
ncbi:hypothetical protein [Halosimplex pelagicum]|uniref:Glycosyltransferase family 39 protein n=1 Tax=Halosimplex pelagicum TaxID=869886 RepID=A0A7D5TC14_9EURY|nr:hypothetical protein [Halosimplex pelagicum]QLH82653.1 hypothetical protein HZS54_13935 [Halosimplex pelagicum]